MHSRKLETISAKNTTVYSAPLETTRLAATGERCCYIHTATSTATQDSAARSACSSGTSCGAAAMPSTSLGPDPPSPVPPGAATPAPLARPASAARTHGSAAARRANAGNARARCAAAPRARRQSAPTSSTRLSSGPSSGACKQGLGFMVHTALGQVRRAPKACSRAVGQRKDSERHHLLQRGEQSTHQHELATRTTHVLRCLVSCGGWTLLRHICYFHPAYIGFVAGQERSRTRPQLQAAHAQAL